MCSDQENNTIERRKPHVRRQQEGTLSVQLESAGTSLSAESFSSLRLIVLNLLMYNFSRYMDIISAVAGVSPNIFHANLKISAPKSGPMISHPFLS